MVHNAPPLPEDAPRRTKLLRALRARLHKRQLAKQAEERSKARQEQRTAEGQPQRSARAELRQVKEEVKDDPAVQRVRELRERASQAKDRLQGERGRGDPGAEQMARRRETQREQQERREQSRQAIEAIGAELDAEFGQSRSQSGGQPDPDAAVDTLQDTGAAFGADRDTGTLSDLESDLAAIDEQFD